MYGESRNDSTPNQVHPDVFVEVAECGGGHTFVLSGQVPRSDLEVIAPSILTQHDFSGDGVDDHQFHTRFSYDDVNGNGRLDRGEDRMRLEHDEVRIIQRGVTLRIGAAELLAVTKRVVAKLGGIVSAG